MMPLPLILLTIIVAGHCWFIAAHARAWQLARAWSPYGKPMLQALASCLAIIAAYCLVPPPLVVILGAELTVGVLAAFLTNSVRTPWTSVPPRNILLLRVPRPAAAPAEPISLQRLLSGELGQG